MAISFSTAAKPAGLFPGTSRSRLGEPYVAVTRIELRPSRPKVEVLLYGAWRSNDPDDIADVAPLTWHEGVWELDLFVPAMADPDDSVVLIALMEHLDAAPSVFESLIRDRVIRAVDRSAHLARNTRVAWVISAIDRAIDCANGGPNLASVVGLSVSANDTLLLDAYGSCRFVRSFHGYGGEYCLGIELKTASEMRTFVPQRHEAFAWAAA